MCAASYIPAVCKSIQWTKTLVVFSEQAIIKHLLPTKRSFLFKKPSWGIVEYLLHGRQYPSAWGMDCNYNMVNISLEQSKTAWEVAFPLFKTFIKIQR